MDAAPHPSPVTSLEPATDIGGAPAGGNIGAGPAPPHLLWETLESAFSAAAIAAPLPPVPSEKRLAGHIAIPAVLALSLMLWVVIVTLVFNR